MLVRKSGTSLVLANASKNAKIISTTAVKKAKCSPTTASPTR